MEDINIYMCLFLNVTGFIAAFIDTVVGGGGLISLPALLFTGMPPVTAIATNKVSASMGATIGFASFVRSGRVDFSTIKYLLPLSFIGSICGASILKLIPSDFLRPLIIILLVAVTIYTLTKKEFGQVATFNGMSQKMWILSAIAAFIFGFYDGFFGPGTGTFLLFAFLWIGFDFIGAAANARGLNFASNIAGALFFISSGIVDFAYAIPMGLAMMVGAFCGARMAIAKGATYVKTLFIIMSIVLIGKQVIDLFK